MGYLSQKKQQNRKNIFFCVAVIVVIFFTALLHCFPSMETQFLNVFHLYCLSGVLLICALIAKKIKTSVLFTLVFLINYTTLSMSGNIFLPERFNGKNSLHMVFAENQPMLRDFHKSDILSSGSLILAHKHIVPYVLVNVDHPLMIIRIDFRKIAKNEYPLVFQHLSEFILKQDVPIIAFGEFGMPVWEPMFRHFIEKTGLKVKNKLLFTEKSSFNIFTIPSFYILGFRNMGISALKIRDTNAQKIIDFKILFD